MADILILGGTRNLGHVTALSLLKGGHSVTILNRGQTRDDLPPDAERLRGDRGDTASMRTALEHRSFDLVFDATTYTAVEARQAVELFGGHAGRHVFVSSGQVYLVREGATRPFREEDYDGLVMPAPAPDSDDHASWLYGVDKRDAEDVFRAAWGASEFPVTTIRLPMVASERDHYGRIQGCIARILDGGPLLMPRGEGLPLRHVYAGDVARLVTGLVDSDAGIGREYNISYGASMTVERFLELLGEMLGRAPQILRVEREALESRGLLPHCAPFSGTWMSELDNTRSVDELTSAGLAYTPPEEYLIRLVEDYHDRWSASGVLPEGYGQRDDEIAFAASLR